MTNQEIILKFIDDFKTANGNTEEEQEIIRRTFRAGYCYYFAVMLKTAFNRGEICWAAPFGHLVWQDYDGSCYDIEGVYDPINNEVDEIIPISFLGNAIDDFIRVEGVGHNTSEKEIEEIICNYRKSAVVN